MKPSDPHVHPHQALHEIMRIMASLIVLHIYKAKIRSHQL